MTQIVADVVADPTLPRTDDHECKRCGFMFTLLLKIYTNYEHITNVL
jgi:hypothetical protein